MILEHPAAASRVAFPLSYESDATVRPCRVLVVDDSPVFLATVGDLLTNTLGIEVIDLLSSGREVLEKVEHLELDLIVSDLTMPEIGGLELTRHLGRSPNSPPVVIMSVDDQPRYRAAALAAGAAGFLNKSDLVAELPILIRQILPHCGTCLRGKGS